MEKRGVEENVIKKFEKMDICAVANASDHVLEELGLTKVGDRLNLVAYCKSLDNESGNTGSMNEESKKKKRALLESFLSRKKVTKTFQKPPNKELSLQQGQQMTKVKTKKIHIGWKHFRNQENTYVLVPLAKGEGCRTIDVPVDMTRAELIKMGKDLFFPNEQSIFGASEEMLMVWQILKMKKLMKAYELGIAFCHSASVTIWNFIRLKQSAYTLEQKRFSLMWIAMTLQRTQHLMLGSRLVDLDYTFS